MKRNSSIPENAPVDNRSGWFILLRSSEYVVKDVSWSLKIRDRACRHLEAMKTCLQFESWFRDPKIDWDK